MKVFIDESGPFVLPRSNGTSVSCVGALVVPACVCDDVLSNFEYISGDFPTRQGEIKGSLLGEREVASVVSMLRAYPVLFEVSAIDLGRHTLDAIQFHKLRQAEGFTRNLSETHGPQLVQEVRALGSYTETMSTQLYVESVLMNEVVFRVIQNTTLYYCQRIPQELSVFEWILDAKDKNITMAEHWWSQTVMGMIQSKSIREPFLELKGGNYEYFIKFQGTMARTPEYLASVLHDEAPFPFVDVKMIMSENLEFRDSNQSKGLQLVDVLVNAIRRALNGNLGAAGWGNIGRLVIRRRKRNAVQLIALQQTDERGLPYERTMRMMDRVRKAMFA